MNKGNLDDVRKKTYSDHCGFGYNEDARIVKFVSDDKQGINDYIRDINRRWYIAIVQNEKEVSENHAIGFWYWKEK